MGEKRTFAAVTEKLGKSDTLIRRWKNKWNWQERAREYDNSIEREAMAKAVKERKAMAERHIGIAMQLQKKALEALNSLEAEEMSAKDIKEFIKMATDLERLNRMLDTDGRGQKADGTSSLADTIVAAWEKRRERGNA